MPSIGQDEQWKVGLTRLLGLHREHEQAQVVRAMLRAFQRGYHEA